MSDCLAIKDLTITYGSGPPAVSGVSLRVRRGEIVGVIGESGSGKSSIAFATLGLLPASATVEAAGMEVNGTDVRDHSERQWCQLRGAVASMVFQEPMTALNPCMQIGAQIQEVLVIHGLADRSAARARVMELLELVRMPDPQQRVHYYPHQLSGGQRQRVVIAIAIAASPALLVADEPTTALDVTVQRGILDLITSLRDTSEMGVLFISHDLGVIGEICDRVYVMYRGRIVESGTTGNILNNPQHPYTQALLESIPRPAVAPRTPLAVMPAQNTFLDAKFQVDKEFV